MVRRPRTLLRLAGRRAVIGALVFAWFGHAFLNYDTFYALVWGGDLGPRPHARLLGRGRPHPASAGPADRDRAHDRSAPGPRT